jgi:hypothetical protein
MYYTETDAKRDMEQGWIHNYRLERWEGGWHVIILNDNGMSRQLTSHREKTKPRVFKTADAALSCLEKIGFTVVLIEGVK